MGEGAVQQTLDILERIELKLDWLLDMLIEIRSEIHTPVAVHPSEYPGD